MSKLIRVAVITVSDRCSKDEKLDRSGCYLESAFRSIGDKYTVVDKVIIPDEIKTIQTVVLRYIEHRPCDVIVLTGGTGFTPRDHTPEAVKQLFHKDAPGIQTALITESLKKTKFAMLSRLVCGIRDQSLIVTFPGSEKACRECFEIVEPVLKHAVDQLRCDLDSVNEIHVPKETLRSKANIPSMVERYSNMPKSKISFNEAITSIVNEAIKRTKEFTRINVEDYGNFGYFSAQELRSPMNLPPFRASLKDGCAVRSVDGQHDRITMSKQISAGESDCEKLKPNYCYRINTGAYIPDDADSIVKVEDTELIEQIGEEYRIKINKIPKPNDDVKQVGADLKENDLLIEKNSELTAASFGLLASVNLASVEVYEKPKISILSTGDELLVAGNSYRLPCIYDSNRTLIKNLLASNHFNKLIDLGIAKDELDSLYNKIVDAFESTDILITSGSVSMGEKDFLKLILQSDFDAQIHFSRIRIKPGMPFVFATCRYKDRPKYVFALPGNPVSAFVISTLFVLPALRLMIQDTSDPARLSKYKVSTDLYDLLKLNDAINVQLSDENAFKKFASDGRPEFVRCLIRFNSSNDVLKRAGESNDKSIDSSRIDASLLPIAHLINEQQHSSKLLSIQGANALVLVDPDNRSPICKAVLL